MWNRRILKQTLIRHRSFALKCRHNSLTCLWHEWCALLCRLACYPIERYGKHEWDAAQWKYVSQCRSCAQVTLYQTRGASALQCAERFKRSFLCFCAIIEGNTRTCASVWFQLAQNVPLNKPNEDNSISPPYSSASRETGDEGRIRCRWKSESNFLEKVRSEHYDIWLFFVSFMKFWHSFIKTVFSS
jgi:hypothetical protein